MLRDRSKRNFAIGLFFRIHPKIVNHPKFAVFFLLSVIPTFGLKKTMFNLNESNRIVICYNLIDLRKGVDSLYYSILPPHLSPQRDITIPAKTDYLTQLFFPS